MKRNRPYGKAFKITKEEADMYARVNRPRSYVPNPLGVTAMASVNGRGAYKRSVKSLARGKSPEERAERARLVMRNGENEMSRRAAFLKNPIPSRHFRGRTSKASPAAAARVAEEKAKAAPKRRKAAAKKAAKPAVKKTAAQISAGNKRRGKRLAAYSAAKRTGLDEKKAARKAVKAVPLTRGETFKGLSAAKTRKRNAKAKVQVGKVYRREKVVDPTTGKKKLSWLYKAKGGKLRKIPHEDIIKAGAMSRERLVKGRERAARRMLEAGSVFVANKRAKKGKKKMAKGTWNFAAYTAAIRAGMSKADAKKVGYGEKALRAKKAAKKATKKTTRKTAKKTTRKTARKPQSASKTRRRNKRRTSTITYEWIKGATVAPVRRLKKAKKAAKKSTKKAAKKSTARKTAKKGTRTAAQRSASAKKAARTRKRNAKKMTKNGRRTHAGYVKSRSGGVTNVVRVKKNGRKSRRSRRGYRRNGFMAQLVSVLKTGLFVAGGFLTHKLLTNLVIDFGVNKLPVAALQNSATFQTWKKPIVGLVTLAVGIPVAQKVLRRNSTEVAAGMAASWFQSVIVTALSKKPEWQGRLSGYNNSRAYALRGAMEKNAFSIAPQYATLSGFQQAAAGYQQAAAGTGEYFAANGVGEYFATSGLQGVGSYEGAGQLALQASAGVDEIDDGIRPDSDIDGLLDLAEAAAGLRGTGEFYSAIKESGGRVVEQRVGMQSQWIPAGPLWAGASIVSDTQDTSELPAGVLSSGGGNGTLST
jgi:hypothetical protein